MSCSDETPGSYNRTARKVLEFYNHASVMREWIGQVYFFPQYNIRHKCLQVQAAAIMPGEETWPYVTGPNLGKPELYELGCAEGEYTEPLLRRILTHIELSLNLRQLI